MLCRKSQVALHDCYMSEHHRHARLAPGVGRRARLARVYLCSGESRRLAWGVGVLAGKVGGLLSCKHQAFRPSPPPHDHVSLYLFRCQCNIFSARKVGLIRKSVSTCSCVVSSSSSCATCALRSSQNSTACLANLDINFNVPLPSIP